MNRFRSGSIGRPADSARPDAPSAPPLPNGERASEEAFQHFLAWLSPDPERAAQRYVEMHAALSRIFASRGCERQDELADMTFDRVIRKIDQLAPEFEGNPAAYVHGVAKRVFLEYSRTHQRRASFVPAEAEAADGGELERRHACLNRCLSRLEPEEQELILEYYRGERVAKIERRQLLAQTARSSQPTLRKRTQRIRERLKECVLRCLAGGEEEVENDGKA
jgi:DNA-directed RNA polymerase specialized sigma24 family protein